MTAITTDDPLAEDSAFRLAARRFVEAELEPLTAEIDRSGAVPERVVELLRDHGFLGLRLSDESGGLGLGLLPYLVVVEELSRSHRVFTLIAEGASGMAALAIERFGTPQQRQQFLPGIASGRLTTAFALTEPGAGSDAAAISTRATPSGDGWLLNGRKHFINGGHTADVILVMAVTDAAKRARGGITAFLVERSTSGFTVTRSEATLGSEAIRLAELTFEDCRLPPQAVLGKVGDGFRVALATLTDARLAIAFACVGIASRLLSLMVEHARSRATFGAPLASRQAIQWMVADSAVEIAATRALAHDAARRHSRGDRLRMEPSMCKLFASEMVGRVADRSVQVFGGAGIVRGLPIERFYRDVRHYRIGEGSSEVQRMLIAREVLGLDSEGKVI